MTQLGSDINGHHVASQLQPLSISLLVLQLHLKFIKNMTKIQSDDHW